PHPQPQPKLPPTVNFGLSAGQLVPAILATDIAAEGEAERAIAFIDSLAEDDPTRLIQRAIVLSSAAVFEERESEAGQRRGAAYLAEAIALTEQFTDPAQRADLWFLISLAQHWRGDSAAAETAMAQAIAISPEFEAINEEILTELAGEPWLFEKASPGEDVNYGAIADFYQALYGGELATAETLLAELSEPYLKVSLQSLLAAAFSQEAQPEKAEKLLIELFGLADSPDLDDSFGDETNLFQAIVSSYASSQGRILPLQAVLGTLVADSAQQQSLWATALAAYSYIDHSQVPLEELLRLRDQMLAQVEAEEQAELLRGLLPEMVRKGGLGEAIALVPLFSPEEQPLVLVTIADVYGQAYGQANGQAGGEANGQGGEAHGESPGNLASDGSPEQLPNKPLDKAMQQQLIEQIQAQLAQPW
ncbi:MAG: hypothetical protein HC824_15920, partial [Synechococcales cyanobacterium RM1_1_8]|nr:hypothetical protein [Synechococcales cyanobacterium RM1_1_8]